MGNYIQYGIYLSLSSYLTIIVGLQLYRRGRIFLLTVFSNDEKLTDTTNRLLFTGYLLLNLGYVFTMISTNDWGSSTAEFIEVCSSKLCIICLTLGSIHCSNLILFNTYYFVKNRTNTA